MHSAPPRSSRRRQTPRLRSLAALSAIAALAALGLAGTGCNRPQAVDNEQWAPEERIVIKFSHVVAENTPKGLAARRFASLVREKTGGRVEVQVFPNGQLVGDGEVEMAALLDGRVHLIAPSTGKLAELIPAWQLFDLPYAFPDQAAVVSAMEGPIGEKLFRLLRRRGFLGLTMWDNGWKQMTSSRRPLVWPEDFAGQKFRVQPSRILSEQFRAVGAEGVPVAFDQTFRALEIGQVDGQENTPSNIYSKKFHEVQRYMTISNHGYLGYVVMTNAAFWENLPPDVRGPLEEALAETTQWVRQNAYRINAADLERIRASGHVQIHVQTPEERAVWEEAFQPVYALFATDINTELALAVQALRRQHAPASP